MEEKLLESSIGSAVRQEPDLDRHHLFYRFVSLQVAWWKALIVAVAMMISWYLTYGRRITVSVGLIVFLLGLSSWSGLLPTSSDLGHFLATLRPEVR